MASIKAFFKNFAIFLWNIGYDLKQRIPNFRQNWQAWQQRRRQRAAARQQYWMEQARRQWEVFYREFFGIDVDLSGVSIPAYRKGFKRIIIVIPGMSIALIANALKNNFQGYRLRGPSFILDTGEGCYHQRSTENGAYAILVRDLQGIRRNRRISATEAACWNIASETLIERLLHGMVYLWETGTVLDGEGAVTICSGTHIRWSDRPEAVPAIHGSNRERGHEISIDIAGSDLSAFPETGIREVIACY